jgi:hypothetical protein
MQNAALMIVCRWRPTEDLQFVSISEVPLVTLSAGSKAEGRRRGGGDMRDSHTGTHDNSRSVYQMNIISILSILQEVSIQT